MFASLVVGLLISECQADLDVPSQLPVGAVIQIADENSIPDGWLKCDGSLKNRLEYKDLFDVIGETYGEGDGSNTFVLPDQRRLKTKTF